MCYDWIEKNIKFFLWGAWIFFRLQVPDLGGNRPRVGSRFAGENVCSSELERVSE